MTLLKFFYQFVFYMSFLSFIVTFLLSWSDFIHIQTVIKMFIMFYCNVDLCFQ